MFDKKAKHFSFSRIAQKIAVLSLLLIMAVLCVAASVLSENTFIVYKGDDVTIFNSYASVTASALSEAGISPKDTEYLVMPETAKDGIARIYIYPKKKITVKISDTETVLYSEKDMAVSEFLADNSIELSQTDIVSVPVTDMIYDGMEVEITRVSYSIVEEIKELPYSTEKRENKEMSKGTTRTIQKGENGAKKLVYTITNTNGTETERTLTSETITKEPTTEIIEYGTKALDTSGVVKTKSGETLSYKKVMTMTATAYTTEGSSDKITATGQVARVGLVAVDRRVIPLGTKLYIEAADGKSWSYGIAVAGDTGVKGNKIDLFFNTKHECFSFGVRKAKVYILK